MLSGWRIKFAMLNGWASELAMLSGWRIKFAMLNGRASELAMLNGRVNAIRCVK